MFAIKGVIICDGDRFCKGSMLYAGDYPETRYTEEQRKWMRENKRLYYTGLIRLDIHHLPQHLRFL